MHFYIRGKMLHTWTQEPHALPPWNCAALIAMEVSPAADPWFWQTPDPPLLEYKPCKPPCFQAFSGLQGSAREGSLRHAGYSSCMQKGAAAEQRACTQQPTGLSFSRYTASAIPASSSLCPKCGRMLYRAGQTLRQAILTKPEKGPPDLIEAFAGCRCVSKMKVRATTEDHRAAETTAFTFQVRLLLRVPQPVHEREKLSINRSE